MASVFSENRKHGCQVKVEIGNVCQQCEERVWT